MKKSLLLLLTFLLSLALALAACAEPASPNPPDTRNPSNPLDPADPSNPADPIDPATDGFAELTKDLSNGDSVSATLSYTSTLLNTTLLGSVPETIPVEYAFTTESQKTFKALGFITSSDGAPLSQEQAFLDTIKQNSINLKGTLIQLQGFQVIIATTDFEQNINGKTFGFTKHLIAYSNSLKLGTQINNNPTTADITVLSEKNTIFSFLANDKASNFIALGYNQSEQLASSINKASLTFTTKTIETSSGTASHTFL